MATSIWQRFKKLTIKETSSKEMCRLRYGLNTNCLLKIFDYLAPYNLVQVCKLDVYFKEIIMKWTIKNKVFNFGLMPFNEDVALAYEDKLLSSMNEELHNNFEILQTFGKSIRKLNLVAPLRVCLESIIKYSQPGTITEIGLETYFDKRIKAVDQELIQLSMPFFSNLHKLAFEYGSYFEELKVLCSEMLTQISITAPNLQILELDKFEIKDGWLNNMQNLRELRIRRYTSSLYVDDLTGQLNPKLKVFDFRGFQDTTTINDVISKNCSGLKKFGDINYGNPYDRFGIAMMNRYNFLSTFPHLNSVKLTSYTYCGCDLYYPFKTLASTNIVELKIFMSFQQPIVLNEKEKAQILRSSVPNFVCLEVVEIEFADSRFSDLRYQFMFHFVSKQKNIKHFKFTSISNLCKIYKVLKVAESIRTLDISSSFQIDEIPREIQDTVRTLRRIRQSNEENKQHILHLILNNRYIYLKDVYKDVMKISFANYP